MLPRLGIMSGACPQGSTLVTPLILRNRMMNLKGRFSAMLILLHKILCFHILCVPFWPSPCPPADHTLLVEAQGSLMPQWHSFFLLLQNKTQQQLYRFLHTYTHTLRTWPFIPCDANFLPSLHKFQEQWQTHCVWFFKGLLNHKVR